MLLRISALVLFAAAAACTPASSRPEPAAALQRPQETIRLWPGAPPGEAVETGPEVIGSEGSATGAYSRISVPRMDVYRPDRPNRTAVLVLGGGGYFRIQVGSAAAPIARWLQSEGTTAFVLYYRLPGDGWPAVAPMQDAQRALRTIRAQAAGYGIDPAKIGVIGSSAGGHLAGMMATRGDHSFYGPVDAIDRIRATPDFAGLLYPVISLRSPIDTTRTRRELGSQADAVAAYSVETLVTAATPPVFLAHTADDPIADVRHSQWMFDAMRRANRPVEMHIFERGGHSWGMGEPGSAVSAWPRLFRQWARSHGFMSRPER